MRVLRIQDVLVTLLCVSEKPYILVEPCFGRPPIIAFTGTRNVRDLLDDVRITGHKWPPDHIEVGIVHAGFAKRTTRLLENHDLNAFLTNYNQYVFTGHRMTRSVFFSTNKEISNMSLFNDAQCMVPFPVNGKRRLSAEEIAGKYVVRKFHQPSPNLAQTVRTAASRIATFLMYNAQLQFGGPPQQRYVRRILIPFIVVAMISVGASGTRNKTSDHDSVSYCTFVYDKVKQIL